MSFLLSSLLQSRPQLKVLDEQTREIVALKKIKMGKERGVFPLTFLREINVLLSFHYPSVVDVKEVVVGSNLDNIFYGDGIHGA